MDVEPRFPDISNVSSSGGFQRSNIVNNDPDLNKQCWVCFEEDSLVTWVKPCRCKGTAKWVHQMCLQRWIDEKQKGNPFAKVKCIMCSTEYIIRYPRFYFLINLMERAAELAVKCLVYITDGVLLASICVCMSWYEAWRIFIIYGKCDGLASMSACNTSVLLVALHSVLLVPLHFIPVALMQLQSIKWERELVRLLTRFTTTSGQPIVGQLPPAAAVPLSATWTLCAALSLPLVAKLVGDFLFENRVQSPLWRFLFGTVFLGIKGAANVYIEFRQMQPRQRCMVVDFVEPATGAAAVVAMADNDNVEGDNHDNHVQP